MAEKRQIGIPDEPLDYTSDFITKPYDLDDTKGYEDQKHEVLSGELKRTVVGENWKIPSQTQERRPQVVQALEGLERGVGDIIKGFLPQEQIKWRTDPVGAAAGWVAALSAPVLVGGAALLEGAESMFPETFGALKPKESAELTRDKLEQVWEDTLQKESQKLEKARTDLESGKISQVQYDAIERQFDTLVGRRQKAFENIDKYNATVQALDGTPYPNAKVADTVVSESARYLQMRELNNAIEMAQKGIDPESTGFKIGSLAGPTAVLGAIGFGGNYLSRYGLSGALRRITSDVETEGGAARLAAIKPVRSRRQAARAGMTAVEVGTEEMESAQYVWENVQDYIERTGDKTLEYFTPQDAKAFSASAYGAIAGKIETMGGIENIAAGAFRRLGVGGFGRRVVATGAEEFAEEGLQNLSEYLSRRIDGTTDKTLGEALEESLNAAAWGGFMGIGFGTIGGVTYRNARKQGIKVLQDYGLSRETAEKVFDNMIEQTTDAISPRNEPVRENIRKKVSIIYEGADMSPAELEDTIEATTDLEMAMIAYDSANRGIDIADHPLLNSTVNNIGWFRDGIPEQIADQVEDLDNEIGNLRRQLAEENAKEKPDMDKIDDLEAKIEQFYAKLPKEVSDLVETDRQKIRQMLGAQSVELQARQAQRRIVQQVQKRATSALQRAQESDVQKSLRRLEQESKTEEKKAKETERQQRIQQRKLRKAIEKLRQNMTKRKNNLPLSQELFADADLVYQALRDSGFSDQQIATMAEEDIVKAVAPYGISPVAKQMAEQSDLADENARLDDIYPEYTGETIVVDGKERTVYNSEGKRINKSAEALTNFWRWFGDSKVVDEQGRPLVVYHGSRTEQDFDTFDKRHQLNKKTRTGFWFGTENIDYGKNVKSVYLKLENPFVFDAKKSDYYDLPTDNKKLVQDVLHSVFGDNYIVSEKETLLSDYLTIYAKNQNNDGVIIRDVKEGNTHILMDDFVAFEPTQIKSVDNRGTYSSDTGNIYKQSKVSGKGADTARGFFVPEYRLVVLTQQADPTTAAHEFAHDWMQQFFRYYRSGQANESFMKSWGAVEKALGITEDDITVPEKASEAFARAFEAWVENKEDWTKGLDIDDDNRDKIVETFKRYQGYLTDIYEDLNNPYFRDTWGETGKLKPELQAWFDKVVIPSDLISAQVATGAITPQEAETKIITRNVNQVVQAAEDNFTQKEKDEINAVERLNDTKRYEVEGGNKNSLQNRLSGLARDIDANNIALGRYDTRRDMLAVAQAADEFVRTRRDEALNIINGLEPEKEGLYASDLYTALERVAMETNDVDLAMDLVNSKVAKDLAKEWGQRVAGFRNFTGDGEFDAISQIKSLDNKYKKDYDEKGKERVKSASDEFVKELDKTDSDQDLDSFFDSVKCQ